MLWELDLEMQIDSEIQIFCIAMLWPLDWKLELHRNALAIELEIGNASRFFGHWIGNWNCITMLWQLNWKLEMHRDALAIGLEIGIGIGARCFGNCIVNWNWIAMAMAWQLLCK